MPTAGHGGTCLQYLLIRKLRQKEHFSSGIQRQPGERRGRSDLSYFFFKDLFMCMDIFSAWVSMHHVHAWLSWKSEKGIGSTVTGVIDTCEPRCVC